MSRIFNPFRGLCIKELEMAYAYFSCCNDAEAVHMVADAFCEEVDFEMEELF